MDKFAYKYFILCRIYSGNDQILNAKSGETGARTRHIISYSSICHVCSMKWAYISKLETLGYDSKFINEQSDLPDNVEPFPINRQTGHDIGVLIKNYIIYILL